MKKLSFFRNLFLMVLYHRFHVIFSLTVFVMLASLAKAQNIKTLRVEGVRQPVVSVNGTWKFSLKADGNFWENNVNTIGWKDIQVPGEPAMQNLAVKYDEPVVYKRVLNIPSDFNGKRVFLRFDGVYSYARLWVNGKFVRDHQGGFTRWENDITELISAGNDCIITLEVTDKKDDISFASGYAKHCIGGILRDVTLYALPQDRLDNMIFETDLDAAYNKGLLNWRVSAHIIDKATVKFSLSDPSGKLVPVNNQNFQLTADKPEQQYSFEVKTPLKWDAEHPNLYTVNVELWVKGKRQYAFSHRIGFRKIEIKGNQLFVNGLPVKLRGACRHDMDPLLGRISTDEYDKLDVQLAKEANMNFIRTSHYPPSQRFVEYCNEMGIYLESETAVCFVHTYRPAGFDSSTATEDAVAYTEHYLSQLKEMVSVLRNEPAVIIWSIGNESLYGINFQKSYDWLKKNDHSRPVIFSYPGTVPEGGKAFDLLSMHYPKYTGELIDQKSVTVTDFNNNRLPVLFDEWAHVPCYVNDILREDPNIREYWGKSLDMMWEGVFNSKGGLGGSIWGMIDETFMIPDTVSGLNKWPVNYTGAGANSEKFPGPAVGYGEWGIVDTWRRKKPEFWSTRKAYSPVRLLETHMDDFIPGSVLQIPVYNRFDQTSLDEIKLIFNYKGKIDSLICPGILPHSKGFITLPISNWNKGESILLSFKRNNVPVDEYLETLGEKPIQKNAFVHDGEVKVLETEDAIVVQGPNFHFPFNKSNGLLKDAEFNGKTVIESGPFLNFSATEAKENTGLDWKLDKIAYSSDQGCASIRISGISNGIKVQFTVRINGNGDIAINYAVDHLPGLLLKELGVKFILPESFDSLLWNRESYWSYYPKPDFGAPNGIVSLYSTNSPMIYGKKPQNDWQFDDNNFYYFGLSGNNSARPLTNVAKSMKENVYKYQLSTPAGSVLKVVSSNAKSACRVNRNINGKLILYANSSWDYPEIGWGDYSKNIQVGPHTGILQLQFKK